jgi:hypothetical protein
MLVVIVPVRFTIESSRIARPERFRLRIGRRPFRNASREPHSPAPPCTWVIISCICSLTLGRLKEAGFCIGGNSMAVSPSCSTTFWTKTNRQASRPKNSLNQAAGTFSFLNKLKWQQLGRLRRAAIDSSDQCQKPQSESPLRRRNKASERSAQQLSQELGAGRLGLEFETLEKRASPCLSAASKSGGSSCSAMKLGVQKVRTYKQNRTLAAARASSILSFHFAPALMLVSSQTASFLRTRVVWSLSSHCRSLWL